MNNQSQPTSSVPISTIATVFENKLPFSAELVEAARKHIAELASSSCKAWRMSIPVKAYDSDMVLTGLCDSHEILRQKVELLESERRWIPVGKKLPEKGKRVEVAVLCIWEKEKQYSRRFDAVYQGDKWLYPMILWVNGTPKQKVTHWRPYAKLPEIPEVPSS